MQPFDFSLTRSKPKPHIRVTFDTESMLIAPCVQAPPPVVLAFAIDGGKVHLVGAGDPAFPRVVESLFRDESLFFVGHKVAYDVAGLMSYGAQLGRPVEWAQMLLGAAHQDRIVCTELRETLYHIALARFDMSEESGFRTNLGACCARWSTPTQPNKADAWRQRYGTLYGTHVSEWPADAVAYVTEDVRATDELYLAQSAHPTWLKDQHRQVRASIALYLMQCYGFRSDPVQAAKLYEKTAAELAAAAELCQSTYVTYSKTKTRSVAKQKVAYEVTETKPLRNPDGSANKKAAEAYMVQWCTEHSLPVPRGKPTEKMIEKDPDAAGNIKLDDAACRATKSPALIAYTDSGQAGTLLSKVKRWSKPVLQPSYTTLKATGRTSCSQGKDPKPGQAPMAYGVQVQNPPKAVTGPCPSCAGAGCESCKYDGEVEVPGVREIMVARPGNVILDIDFTGLEQCMLAQVEMWLFGESDLAVILNDPKRSALVELGARIYGISAAEGYAMKATDPKRFKEMRNLAKGPAYGLPGGMGWARLIGYCQDNYGVTVTEEVAKAIAGWKGKDAKGKFVVVKGLVKEEYRQRERYLEIMNSGVCPPNKVGAKTSKSESGIRMTHPYSLRVRGGCRYTDGNNSWFQGLGSDCAKESTWRVTVECYAVPASALFGSRPIAFVHDQALVESAEETYVAAAKRLEELWVGGAQEICTDVLIQAKPAATRRWSKSGGDAVYWPDGTLAVYEDFLLASQAKPK
jgi:hypothetical protein